MGLFDGILGYFGALGQQAGQIVTAPYSGGGPAAPSSGGSVPTQQAPAPQPIQINPIGAITGWGSGALNYVGSGITNISSGIQTFIQPVAQPMTQAIQSAPLFIAAPITAPVIIGSAFIGGVQSFLNPPVQQQITSPIFSSGAGYTPITINPITNTPSFNPQAGMSIFVPGGALGDQSQIQVNNLNAIAYDPVGGGWIGTTVPYGHSISNIITGGGPGSLQSGMFTTKPNSPAVYTQESVGTVFAPTADLAAAALLIANPSGYSRLGAERYGGTVSPLVYGEAGKLQPGTQMGVYPASSGNLANLVNPYGVNQPKSTWAEMPWNTPVMTTPGIFAVSSPGATGTYLTPVSQRGLESIGWAAPVSASLPANQATMTMGSGVLPVTSRNEMSFIDKLNYDIGGFLGIRASGLEQTGTGTPTKYAYRNDPLAILLEGAVQFGDVIASSPSTLTGGLIPAWTPGSDLLTRYGQNANPVYDTFSSNLAAVEAQKPQYDQLGSHITATQTQINQMTSGKINAQGQFTGTESEYAQYKAALADMNADVATYNQYGEKQKSVIQSGFASGAIIPTGNGGYQPNPDLAKKYGAFSEWSADTTRFLRGGTTEAQIAAYEQTPAYKNAGAFTWFGEGSWKVLTNPVSMANSALLGVELYAGMGLVGAGFAAASPAAGIAPVGIVETVGVTGLRTMASPIFQYGTGALFLGAGVWSSTEGFTAPPERSVSNLGGMTIHLAAMTGGALAPEGMARGYNYGTVRFAEKPMIVQTETNVFEYSQRPDVKVASGVGGEMKLTSTQTIASQPSISVFGYEIAFPRIFEPRLRGSTVTTTDLGYGDVGSLLDARLGGTRAEPLYGQRVETMKVETFRSQELAHGTGDLRIAEVRLPRTIDEYVSMGAADQKLIGLSGEEITAALMQNAADVTPATTGYRTLDAYAPRGTPVREFFDWTGNVQGGQSVEFNRINIEDFFGSMRVTQTGNARSAYEVNVVRDVTEQGFMESGNYEVTGSQTPEAKIVTQLQEASRNMVTNAPAEPGFGFDSRGNLVVTKTGQANQIDLFSVKQTVASDVGDIGSVAHGHPKGTFELRNIYEGLKSDLGENPNPSFPETRTAIKWETGWRAGAETLPSRNMKDPSGILSGDINAMQRNDLLGLFGVKGRIAGEYIVSGKGVTIIRPDATGSWNVPMGDVAALPPIDMIKVGGPTGVLETMRSTGADITFIGKNEIYRGAGHSERIIDTTGEMQAAYPEGVRSQFVDMVDRMTLKNPNMEFIREPGTISGGGEPSLLESGSNLGRGGVGYQSPVSTMQAGIQSVAPQSSFRQSIVEPARGQRVSGGTEFVTAGVPKSTPFETPAVLESRAVSRSAMVGPALIGSTEFAQAFAQFSVSQQVSRAQPQGQRSSVDVVRAMAMGSDVVQSVSQRSQQDFVKALAMGSDVVQGVRQAQSQDLMRVISPIQSTRSVQTQTPWQEILPVQRQTPYQITPQIITPTIPPTPQIQVPWKPVPPITPIPPWGFPPLGVPGSGGGGGSRKRRGAFVEIFNMGLDYSLKQRSKRQGKSWAQPKKVQKARAAAKKGGKKK
jgi:hypothetical protein